MTKASKLLNTIKENKLDSSLINFQGEDSYEDLTNLDIVLEILEELKLGTDCLKSTYTEDVESVVEMLDAIEDDEVIDEDFLNDLVASEISEAGKTALVQPKPYHNIFSKSVGDKYTPIMKGREKGGNADVSTLELGTDKFYNKDNKHYTRLWKDAVNSNQPRRQYQQLVRALVNLVVNFKKRKPELSAKAKRILKVVTTLPRPKKYFDSKK